MSFMESHPTRNSRWTQIFKGCEDSILKDLSQRMEIVDVIVNDDQICHLFMDEIIA